MLKKGRLVLFQTHTTCSAASHSSLLFNTQSVTGSMSFARRSAVHTAEISRGGYSKGCFDLWHIKPDAQEEPKHETPQALSINVGNVLRMEFCFNCVPVTSHFSCY